MASSDEKSVEDTKSEIDRSDPIAWEKAVNGALTAAKRECERHPKDEQRTKRYQVLKEDYKAAVKAKAALNASAAPKQKKQPKLCREFLESGKCQYGKKCRFSHDAPVPAPSEKELSCDWTCSVCSLTMKLSEKAAHESTKRHLKALHLQEKATLMWRCIPCQITIGASMRSTHETGKKHSLRVADAKAGDWYCLCGQHNYHTKTTCVKVRNGVKCERKREFKGNIEIGAGGVEWDPSEQVDREKVTSLEEEKGFGVRARMNQEFQAGGEEAEEVPEAEAKQSKKKRKKKAVEEDNNDDNVKKDKKKKKKTKKEA